MRFLLLLALVTPGLAVDILTPVIGSGFCLVQSISAANPAVITVVDIARCGIANDDPVWVHGIRNTGSTNRSSINLHFVNSSDNLGGCRIVKSVGTGGNPNSFTLRACDGTTNLANNGTYSAYGQIAKGQFRTIAAYPGYYDATTLACLSDTSSTGCAYAARAEYTVMLAGKASCTDLSIEHEDDTSGCTLFYALGWVAEGKPSSSTNKTRLINGMTKGFWRPTAACDGSLDCLAGNITASSYGDYVYEVYAPSIEKILLLGWEALNSTQKASLERYFMDDFDYTKGGHDYDGSTKGYDVYRTLPGGSKVTYTTSSASITGTGTDWTSGDIGKLLILGGVGWGDQFGIAYKICAVASTTSMTLCKIPSNLFAGGTSVDYRMATLWPDDGTKLGYFGLAMLNNYGMMCGSYPAGPGCGDYGSGAGGTKLEPGNNHQVGRSVHHTLIALILATNGSKRAAWLATDGLFTWYHNVFPLQENFGGISSASSHYHLTRLMPLMMDMMGALTNCFTDAPDFTGGGANGAAWWDELAKFALGVYRDRPADEVWQYNGELGTWPSHYQTTYPLMAYMLFKPSGAWAPAVKYYLLNDSGSYNNFGYAENQPNRITAARGTNTTLLTTAPLSTTCVAQWDATTCGLDRRFVFSSRSGNSAANAWNGSGVNVFYNMNTIYKRDHEAQVHDVGIQMSANNRLMLSADGSYRSLVDVGHPEHGNMLVLNGTGNLKNTAAGLLSSSTPIYWHGTGTLGAMGVDTTDHYTAGINLSNRSVIVLKASGNGFVILRDDYVATTNITASQYTHFNIGYMCAGGDDNPAHPSCLTLSRASKTVSLVRASVARLDAKFSGTVDTANSSDTDGTYPTGIGNTFRVTNSVTGTSGTLWSLFRPSGATTDAMPAFAESDTGAFHVVEFKDTTYAAVAAVPAVATLNQSSVSFTTSYAASAGQVAVLGLNNGTYTLSRGGTPITLCAHQVVTSHVFDCPDAGVSGAMSLAADTIDVGGRVFGGRIVKGGR